MKIKWVKRCDCLLCRLRRLEFATMARALAKAIDKEMMAPLKKKP